MSTPIPRPGQHLPGPPPTVDPARIHAEVDELLAGLDTASAVHDDPTGLGQLPRQAHLLEQAHDVLVQALATVDKI
ncbi:hypothetical protein [Rhodococcus tukisamuensis]|uniref:Uncharacterized protein n=1 Tax=Rhodococcus tukisamuensis TaxID=168276 RepID=A0A1G6V427_9NOCA|nr:hypothetical protein [Rhodococcus tukisamuensis]SDD47747.1 hypothetical protein SAMN05444580_104377 [Rhodococcus tukisamuensis]